MKLSEAIKVLKELRSDTKRVQIAAKYSANYSATNGGADFSEDVIYYDNQIKAIDTIINHHKPKAEKEKSTKSQ